ncbi:anthranilate synthase component I [Roseibacillus ishigakijimensis]|uniref:Anthranilate synthase component 1 n=1 Tax=Roseibacillus ishigakijimensis TaxID=454146 RepID=A0A934RS48_9BACT|nr:anthranilate synthase component I [Roseibacillus ishigakijimensis]MBK1833511.1 anthranilate synthase component I [Roseibacillus ishigakijimensis]
MRAIAVKPEKEEFCQLAKQGNVVPVYAQLAADFETPLSAYLKIRDGKWGFLLESAESTDASGRWSLVGTSPRGVFRSQGRDCEVVWANNERETFVGDPLAELEKVMSRYQVVEHGDAPPFYGGAVGYLGYDAVRTFEPSIRTTPEDDLGLPESLYMIAGELLIFDHKLRRLFVVANAFLDEHESAEEAWADACGRIAALEEMLERPLQVPALNGLVDYEIPPARSNVSQERYEENVRRAQEYIAAGDAFQIVPSQRFETDFTGGPTDLYRALRHVNPSPYLFILELDGFSLVGSSPETHVKALAGRIDIRPIAGTRWRGKTAEEDDALAADLLADEKERAEHLMLVDLARNDVGRIAEHGSVQVDDFMIVERYSHVMHIVSNVSGKLDESHSSYDVLRSTFPAGTVSGAPKIRAMQIINELETTKRGAYSGAVGYFGWDGSHDSCIALRTVLLKDGKAYVQAGAGVVADSVPTSEYEETRNKAAGMLRAIGLAKTLLKNEQKG